MPEDAKTVETVKKIMSILKPLTVDECNLILNKVNEETGYNDEPGDMMEYVLKMSNTSYDQTLKDKNMISDRLGAIIKLKDEVEDQINELGYGMCHADKNNEGYKRNESFCN